MEFASLSQALVFGSGFGDNLFFKLFVFVERVPVKGGSLLKKLENVDTHNYKIIKNALISEYSF